MALTLAKAAVVSGMLALCGCSSLPVTTASSARAVDFLNDDVANLLVAFDLPDALEPVATGSALVIDVGGRQVRATLAETDPGDLAGTLPPPGDERTYYLFGFSDADKAAIRAAQVEGRAQPGRFGVSFTPALCRTEKLDVAAERVSVLAALPGVGALAPLVANQPLSTVLAAQPGTTIGACAGHSG